MAIYGVDYYGKAFYGGPVLQSYAVQNLAAMQLDFGHVRISWTAPTPNVWTQLMLVRSQYGFPASIDDGQQLATFSSTQASTSYDDLSLTPGYWYYSVFAAVPLAAWSADLTYQNGDRVSYSEADWIAAQTAPPGQAPASGSQYWLPTEQSSIWQPAGAVGTMSVADHGYSALMNGYIPVSYKSAPVLSTDDTAVNDDLSDFISVLAFGFELVGTELDDLFHLYNTATTRLDRLQSISQMVGVSVEAASSPRYQRLRTSQAAALGRAKGTRSGLEALITATTGLACTIATGPNAMLKRDQSDFPYPLWPTWQTDESYKVDDQVSYQGKRYQCIPWTLVPSLTGSPNTASVSAGITTEASATSPSSLSAVFNAPVAGVYEVSFELSTGPAQGVVGISVDGLSLTPVAPAYQSLWPVTAAGIGTIPSGVVGTTIDTYSAAPAVSSVYVCAMEIPAGSHTLAFSCSAKDGSSTGYGIGVASVSIAAMWEQYPPSSTPPSDGTAGTAAQWAAPNAASMPGYGNPQTGQVSTWTSSLALGVDYFGPSDLTMDTSWLAAGNAEQSAGTVYSMTSAAAAKITAWSSGTAYTAGQIVTGPDGFQYTAQGASTGVAPPSPGTWLRSGYTSPYDRELIGQSTTPLQPLAQYMPQSVYGEGDQVQYGESLFVTPNGTANTTPPASPASNSGWEYGGPVGARTLTASFYNPQPSTGYDTVYPGIGFFDGTGKPIVSPSMMSPSGTVASVLPVYARLIEPVAELSGAPLDVGGGTWTANLTGFWQVSSGVAASNPAWGGTQALRLLYTNTGMSDGCVGVTFLTGVGTPTQRDVGIVFRLSDVGDFFMATRSEIYQFTGGVPSTLATYGGTRLPIGARVFVQMLGSTISVYYYGGDAAAPSLVTTVTSAANETATSHGLADWTIS